MQEIERKFLVQGEFPRTRGTRIVQGYLSRVPQRTVRVRITSGLRSGDAGCENGATERGFLTIKGESDAAGVSRFEWEREIAAADARALLALAEPGIIDKTRWVVEVESMRTPTESNTANMPNMANMLNTARHHVFEIDEFHGEHKGLIIAEIELSSPDEPFARPPWLGQEVTGDARYYNSSL